MSIRIEGDDLDRVAPFGVLCDEDLVVVRTGTSWNRLTADFAGVQFLDAAAHHP